MPGIYGVLDSSAPPTDRVQRELFAIVERMSAAMRYEPSYAVDIMSSRTMAACVGCAGFPTGHGSGDLIIQQNFTVMTAGGNAASEILLAYERFGESGLERLDGTAGFLIDEGRAICLLFNDRYGMERLFVHRDGARTYFASEAKAILAVAPKTREFDADGLAQFLACGCTLGTQSLFRNVEVLEPGTVLSFEGATVARRRYFDRGQLECLEPVSDREFLEGFSESLRRSVNHFVSTMPKVGISLTGGLDSRMVMASLDAPAGSVPCYTFGSMYRTTGDVAVGKQVAARCGQPHSVLELGKPFLRGIAENLEQAVYVSDGYMGLSGAAELYVNRLARSMAPARMTGNWGGELMRGVRAFKYVMPKGDFISARLVNQIQESTAAFSAPSTNPLSMALFHQVPFQGYGRYAIERSQVVMRAPFLADDVVRWLYRAPASVRESTDCAAAVIGRRPELLAIPTDRGELGTKRLSVGGVWRRALIKAEYLTSHGAPDWLARLSASVPAPLLETRFLGVDKFHHFRFWMRRDLSGYVRDVLIGDHGDLGEWFNMSRVSDMVDEHIDGRANYTTEIDKLLTIALAKKMFFEKVKHVQCR